MNFIAQESAQKLRGGFYTAPEVASFLAQWALEKKPRSLLEPSCGDGAFLEAVTRWNSPALAKILACEINPEEAAKARARVVTSAAASIQVHEGDFLQWFLFRSQEHAPFEAIIGNPPFVRYQYLAEEQQFLAEKIVKRFGLPFTQHTNAWVPFVVAAVDLLAPGGRLAMVLPSEIFHIPHAEAARRFLSSRCARTLILDPEDLWFGQSLQGVVLLLAEKAEGPADRRQGIAAQSIQRGQLQHASAASRFDTADFAPQPDGKWMPIFLSSKERALLEGCRADERFARFDQLAEVDVGIVTGANQFFLVSDQVVEEFELHAWARPMIGRSEHIQGVIYRADDHQANRLAGVPTNLLWFDDRPPSAFPERVQAYLRKGEQDALPSRFKCRVREPWFRVPSVYASPVSMLKRAHHFPRLILNEASVFTTDTAYRVRVKPALAPSLVYSFVNSLTALSAELEGRHYGGGVLELVPSEIERLILPNYSCGNQELDELDRAIRARSELEQLFAHQDERVLGAQGVSRADREALYQAWDRLRQRRQRTPQRAEARALL